MTVARVFLLIAVAAGSTEAQRSAPRETFGVNAGIALTHTRLTLDSAAEATRLGFAGRFGIRVCALCLWDNTRWLSVTPLITIAATDVAGIDRSAGGPSYAFGRVDMGFQLAARVGTVRPYASLWLKTLRTAEVDRDDLNYYESENSPSVTWGLEIPLKPDGRGFDISATRLDGRFNRTEFLETFAPASLGYQGWQLAAGWSGPFSGTTFPPWK